MSPRAMGVCRALPLFGDAKQDMGDGKSGSVETGLTGPAAIRPCDDFTNGTPTDNTLLK